MHGEAEGIVGFPSMDVGGKSNMTGLLVLGMAQGVTLQGDEANRARTMSKRHSQLTSAPNRLFPSAPPNIMESSRRCLGPSYPSHV